jgi:N-acetylated-alpha-linked acidic dipeptidase
MKTLLKAIIGAAAIFPSLLASPTTRTNQNAARLSGFSAEHAQAQRSLEQRFRAIPDPLRAEANLRHLTSEPHMAGTEANRRVAEWLRDQYRAFGFDAEIVTYRAWMPLPRSVELEMLTPVKKMLASPEKSIPDDKDSSNPAIPIAFNAYSPSADVTAPLVYVNYGMPEDYRALDGLGISVVNKIVLARYGHGYRGIKTKLAEERKAAGVILYSDPDDDGYAAGDTYPNGPWRPMSGIQRGSVMYTQIYPGDPLTSGSNASPTSASVRSHADPNRVDPSDAANIPHIPTIPINAQDAEAILSNLQGPPVPHGWQGALPLTYHIGPGSVSVRMEVAMDYAERPIYDVIATLRGTDNNNWVVLGNHHDAWVFGGADPGSGTAAMLEVGRALGELARSGWKPRRTVVIGQWDAEEQGLIGSTEWVEANRAALESHAVAYINTDVGVTGPNFSASATPSLAGLIRDAAREVDDPGTRGSVYQAWHNHTQAVQEEEGAAATSSSEDSAAEPAVGSLGAGSDFCPFLDHIGIPSIDLSFGGDYGVYHSAFDDFAWMKHFGDPDFSYEITLARMIGTIALRLDEADLLPFDYSAYAAEVDRELEKLSATAKQSGDAANVQPLSDAAAVFHTSASRATEALRSMPAGSLDSAAADRLDRSLVLVEQDLLAPEGLTGRPWFKHTIYAPGSYTGYSAEAMPGVVEAMAKNDPALVRHESTAVAGALLRASARLDEIARLAREAATTNDPPR